MNLHRLKKLSLLIIPILLGVGFFFLLPQFQVFGAIGTGLVFMWFSNYAYTVGHYDGRGQGYMTATSSYIKNAKEKFGAIPSIEYDPNASPEAYSTLIDKWDKYGES